VNAYLDRPASQRAASLGVVVLLHVAVLALILARSGMVPSLLPVLSPVQVLPPDAARPPPPPPIVPLVRPPDLLPVPAPDIVVAPPPGPRNAPTAIARLAPHGPPVSHFGAASGDTGLGVALATSGTGGARGRGSLGDFEAAVKRAILARKVQPALAWDRRNTCVVNYTASVAPDGSLAGMHIEPCAVAEINEAAREAIRRAAPFARPPDLGGATYDVHGTLIFHP
jgi:protein TonB